MISATATILTLILIALGFLGIILSFLVPDRKKATIALVLSGLIIFTGVFQWMAQSIDQYRRNRRMGDFPRQQQVDWQQMRDRLKNQPQQKPLPPVALPVKKAKP